MSVPKRKNNIKVYPQVELSGRRKELLNQITKSDTFLPDEILHDDLDRGMKDYVLEHFRIVSDGAEVPIIPRILTIQRWGEVSNMWEYSDDDNNIKVPFISIVRKPDPQPGTNPSVQRTIPDRKTFYYHSIPTWNGTTNGFDIYKIPQPVAVDISYDITIVTTELRDLNKLNKIVLEKFSSRQSYTTVKGHYIPIILNSISDSSPINVLEGRRFYVQTYSFIMLGLLLDSEEFEVTPGMNRAILTTEIVNETLTPNIINRNIEISEVIFKSDGKQLTYSVNEIMYELLLVTVNGVVQTLDENFYHISNTSKITFIEAPYSNDKIIITYISNKNLIMIDEKLNKLLISNKNFVYDGNPILTFDNDITDVFYLSINGLIDENVYTYNVSGNTITLNYSPLVGSIIDVKYVYINNDVSFSDNFINKYGKILSVVNEYFTYDGTSLSFTTENKIKDVVCLTINGVVDEIYNAYIFNNDTITLKYSPILNSKIGITYIR